MSLPLPTSPDFKESLLSYLAGIQWQRLLDYPSDKWPRPLDPLTKAS